MNKVEGFLSDYLDQFGKGGRDIRSRIEAGTTPGYAWPLTPEDHLTELRQWESNVKSRQTRLDDSIPEELAKRESCGFIAENTKRWVSSRRAMQALQNMGYEYDPE